MTANRIEEAVGEIDELRLHLSNTWLETKSSIVNVHDMMRSLDEIKSILQAEERVADVGKTGEGELVTEIIKECKFFNICKCPKCGKNVYSDIEKDICLDCGTKLIWNK